MMYKNWCVFAPSCSAIGRGNGLALDPAVPAARARQEGHRWLFELQKMKEKKMV